MSSACPVPTATTFDVGGFREAWQQIAKQAGLLGRGRRCDGDRGALLRMGLDEPCDGTKNEADLAQFQLLLFDLKDHSREAPQHTTALGWT
jgi:hypothetical protein